MQKAKLHRNLYHLPTGGIFINWDFEAIDTSCFNCFDTVVASIALVHGKSFELMFLDNWGFSFDSSSKTLDEALDNSFGDILLPLHHYHGLKLKEHNMEAKEALLFVSDELKKDKSVILNTDIYWCPWNSRYKNISSLHSIVIVDIDEKNKSFLCIDKTMGYFNNAPDELPYEDFLKGYKSLATLTFENPIVCSSWKSILKDAVFCYLHRINHEKFYRLNQQKLSLIPLLLFKSKAIIRSINKNPFVEMRQFAHKLRDIESWKNEIIEGIPIPQQNIVKKISDLCDRRRKFAVAIEYIGRTNKVEQLVALSREMNNLGWMWKDVAFNVYEALNGNNTAECINKAADTIEVLSAEEEEFAKKLLEVAFEKDF